jgi:kynurenine 3-monooxygenase
MVKVWPDFEAHQEAIPGEFKVVRLSRMPPKLDPAAVALVVPKSGGVSAFIEPTVASSCCILFAGNNASDPLLSSTNTTLLQELIAERFPKLQGIDLESSAEQLAAATTGSASLVKCPTFHYAHKAALVGDAAHATGGVSGQGVNSALVDSVVLADCLGREFDASAKSESVRRALLQYSQRQVPEAKALYELSFGPKPKSLTKKLRLTFQTVRDSLFKGRWGIGRLPLRTKLTTSLQSFADIRRDRNADYDEDFPTEAEWNQTIAELDAKVKTAVKL